MIYRYFQFYNIGLDTASNYFLEDKEFILRLSYEYHVDVALTINK